MKHAGTLFLVLFTVWLLWSGHYTTLLLTLGLFSCLFVLLSLRRMEAVDRETAPAEVGLRGLIYLPWLLWEIFRANLDVAGRIIRPRLPIRPQILRVRAGQRTDIGRVIYANSITLTPGTVTVGLDDDELTIHAICDKAADGLRSGEMDRRVTKVEGTR